MGIDVGSRHKMGDIVVIDFYECGVISTGIISSVKYTDYGKLLYDVKIYPFPNERENRDTFVTIKDVDSYFVKTEAEYILKQ